MLIESIEKLTSIFLAPKLRISKSRKISLITIQQLFYYSFVAQDELQAFHWNNVQATLHPIVIYYREQGKFKESRQGKFEEFSYLYRYSVQ